MPTMSKVGAGLLVLAFAGLGIGLLSGAQPGEGTPAFELTSVRTDEVITLRTWGGYGGHGKEYSLVFYGDGRVVASRTQGGERNQTAESYVAFDDMHAAVASFVAGNTLTLTPQKIEETMPLRLAGSSDLGWTELTVNLASVDGGAPREIKFACKCSVPRWAKMFPSKQEPAAVRDLLAWVYARGRADQ